MHFKKEYRYKTDLDTLVDRSVENMINNPEVMIESPDIKACDLLKKEDMGEKVKLTFRYCAHGEIPKVLQQILTPKMLSWLEESVWDRKTKTYTYKIKTFYFTKQFSCVGHWKYFKNGDGVSMQTVEGDLNIRIPVFGPLIEKEVIKHLMKNFDEGYRKTSEELKTMAG